MNKLIILSALFAIALAAPEPPVSAGEDTMEGLTLDPELLARITEILGSNSGGNRRSGGGRPQSYSAPQSSYRAPQSQSSYSAPSQSQQAYQSRGSQGVGGRSAGGATGGPNRFEIDEIQPAPLVADFDFENSGSGAGVGRSNGGGYAPQTGGYNN